jgi:hypothetical protein
MHCEDVREAIVDGELHEGARQHLTVCADCRSLARDREILKAGWETLAKEAAPEPSWGFAARVLRRLDESAAEEMEFFERVGRRVVYAASVVAAVVLMALALPGSGPLRGTASAELSLASAATSTTAAVLFTGEIDESDEMIPLPVAVNGVELK